MDAGVIGGEVSGVTGAEFVVVGGTIGGMEAAECKGASGACSRGEKDRARCNPTAGPTASKPGSDLEAGSMPPPTEGNFVSVEIAPVPDALGLCRPPAL